MSEKPKKKYLDKVKNRLEEVKTLFTPERLRLIIEVAMFVNKEKLERFLQGEKARRKNEPREPGSPAVEQGIHNTIDHFNMLLHKDIGALLTALEEPKSP
jgi:hypothetical protein